MNNSLNTLPPDDVRFIINALRRSTIKWPGRRAALDRARKRVLMGRTKKGKPIYKWHWQCAKCLKWFRDVKSMEVDHVLEIGSFCGNWNLFLARMFPQEHASLQVLCVLDHLKKTNAFNAAHLKWKRKIKRDSGSSELP